MIDNALFNKWKKEYICNINLDNIEYLELTTDELLKFLNDNYLDNDTFSYVSNQDDPSKPIGLTYLDYNFLNYKNPYENEKRFLIGTVSNNKGKKTIVSVFKYYKNYFFSNNQKVPLTYILSIEVNEFFRTNGLCKKTLIESLNHINLDNPIITTLESDIGYEIGVINIMKKIYYNHGFNKDIRSIGEYDETYEKMINGDNFSFKKT